MNYDKIIEENTKKDIMYRENPKEKCRYFPCHNLEKEEFDCRTCYCPLYKICSEKHNTTFGGYLLENKVWACEKCTFIHKKEVVEEIIELRQKGMTYEQIYEILLKIKNIKGDIKNERY